MKAKIIKILWFIAGVLLMANAIWLCAMASNNAGVLAELLLGVALAGYGVFYNKIQKLCKNKLLLFIKRIFFIVLTGVALFSLFLNIYGMKDNADYSEDVLIVLGGGIHETKPGEPLARRLDKAAEYLGKNKNAIAVVSGGSGTKKALAEEKISEAEVMEAYLIEKGIDKSRIIKEDKSTSTYENFVFTKQILDKRFAGDYKAVFVTNEFHIFRAERLAKNAGFEDIGHLSAPTPWHMIFANCLRENMASLKLLVLGS